jgi:general nucleoside transport system ATP-binding protein
LSSPALEKPPAIALRGISKRFGATWANRAIDLEILAGEVHAVVGENGAGKSTLMKIIYGHVRPTAGQIYVNGHPVNFHHPREAMQNGIGMVHQQVLIFPRLTALENIIVGAEPNTLSWIKRNQARRRVTELCGTFGFDLALNSVAGELSYASRQQMAILRALYRDARILILDEPTSLLAAPEVERLLNFLKELRNQGETVVFISHRLQEVFAVANRISVLCDGRLIATFVPSASRLEQVARSISPPAASGTAQAEPVIEGHHNDPFPASLPLPDRPLLVLEDVTTRGKDQSTPLAGLCLSVHEGEILGIGGVVGNGLRTLARTVMGYARAASGRLWFEDQDITGSSMADRLRREFRWLPANPLEESLLPTRPLWENLLLGRQRQSPFQSAGLMRRNQVMHWTRQRLRDHHVIYSNVQSPLFTLSGGNQQKLALSKVLAYGARFVILEQPGRGLDLQAQTRMVQRVRSLNADGVTFLVLSYDLRELLSLCHRIGIVYRGRLMGIVRREDARQDELSQWMLGLCKDSSPCSY